jgi:hypothetical protein
MTEPLWLLL